MTQQAHTTAATRDIFTAKCSAWSWAPWPNKDFPDKWERPNYGVVTLGYFIEKTQGEEYAYNINEARDLMSRAIDMQHELEASTDPEEKERLTKARDSYLSLYKWLKEKNPCAMLGGINESRGKDDFASLSRVLCIDIDAPKPGEPDNGNAWVTDWEKVKNELGALPWVAYSGLSAGGRGVFLLIPIEREDADSYAEYYRAWTALLKKHKKLATDEGCKNRNRLRFMTYDPAPIINHAAQVWCKVLPAPRDWRSSPQLVTPCTLNDEQKRAVKIAVNYCTANGISIADNYDDWMHLAAFFAHCWDDNEGAEMFHALASLSHQYRPGENDRKLSDLRKEHPNPVKFGTFAKLCKDNGVPIPGTNRGNYIAPWPGTLGTSAPAPWTPPKETAQERKEPPQDEREAPEQVTTPPEQETPPQAPQMSESEAYILSQASEFIAEGRGMLQRMRESSPELDKLCNDLDLDYCGHIRPDGKGWIMTQSQFNAFYNG